MRIHMTEEREKRLERAMRAMSENTKSKAIDRALAHYLNDLENKKRVAPRLDDELADELSTPFLPIERETRVGSGESE